MKLVRLFGTLLVILTVQTTWAEIPASLSYQGVLKDSGTPLEGSHVLQFRFFESETGGSHIWERIYSTVDFTNGVFGVTPEAGSPTLGTLAFDKPYWMGVAVDSAADLSPRVPLTASAYSLNTRIPGGTVVTSLNGLKDDVVLEQGAGVTISKNANTLTISATGGGGVTIPDGSITAAKLANNAVTETKIATNAVTAEKVAINAVTAAKIATGAVVKELNGFKDNVSAGML